MPQMFLNGYYVLRSVLGSEDLEKESGMLQNSLSLWDSDSPGGRQTMTTIFEEVLCNASVPLVHTV